MLIVSWIRYLYWNKSQKKKFMQYYLFKNWGPPSYKLMRKFKKLTAEQREQVQLREAQYDALYPNRLTFKHEVPVHH